MTPHLEVVARYRDLMQAELDKSMLEGAGIGVILSHDDAGGMLPLPGAGVIRLAVPPGQADEARQLLEGNGDPAGEEVP